MNPTPPMFDPTKEREAFADALAGLDLDDHLGSNEAETSLGFLNLLGGKTDFTRTLSQGMSGDDVKKAQKKLKALGYPVPTSGSFGATTEGSVRNFQEAQDIPATGKIDATTWDLLMKKGSGSQGLNTFLDAFSLTQGAVSAAAPIIQGQEEPPLYEEVVEEEGPDWLLIGGLTVGGIVLVGGLAWLVSR